MTPYRETIGRKSNLFGNKEIEKYRTGNFCAPKHAPRTQDMNAWYRHAVPTRRACPDGIACEKKAARSNVSSLKKARCWAALASRVATGNAASTDS
jgi:hypothetical protein